ncbi:MAG: GyrI-like domain-containing protein [Deltaproteobacteria bacterium]|jgi:predicted transcriptional regulator YdeE|nr:GyrI-like domain-containing protein [Deltaproteobacteria bacterium]
MDNLINVDAIETLPRKRLVGYCAILNDKAVNDYYERLWLNFLNRINKVPSLASKELYGVCTNLQTNNYFEYWTTVECSADEQIPDDLAALPLSGGVYGSRVERPEFNLPSIYSRRVSPWVPPEDFELNWRLPFFEVYRPNWFQRSTVKFCIPLINNS